jgi:hypothetical protein
VLCILLYLTCFIQPVFVRFIPVVVCKYICSFLLLYSILLYGYPTFINAVSIYTVFEVIMNKETSNSLVFVFKNCFIELSLM